MGSALGEGLMAAAPGGGGFGENFAAQRREDERKAERKEDRAEDRADREATRAQQAAQFAQTLGLRQAESERAGARFEWEKRESGLARTEREETRIYDLKREKNKTRMERDFLRGQDEKRNQRLIAAEARGDKRAIEKENRDAERTRIARFERRHDELTKRIDSWQQAGVQMRSSTQMLQLKSMLDDESTAKAARAAAITKINDAAAAGTITPARAKRAIASLDLRLNTYEGLGEKISAAMESGDRAEVERLEGQAGEIIDAERKLDEETDALGWERAIANQEKRVASIIQEQNTDSLLADVLRKRSLGTGGTGAVAGAGEGDGDEDSLTPPAETGGPEEVLEAGIASGLTGGPLTQAIYDAQSVQTGEGKEGWGLEAAKEAADLYNVGDGKGWAYADNQGNLQRFPSSPLMTGRWLKEHVGTSTAIEKMLDEAVEDEWITKGEKASKTPAVMKKYVKAWAKKRRKRRAAAERQQGTGAATRGSYYPLFR